MLTQDRLNRLKLLFFKFKKAPYLLKIGNAFIIAAYLFFFSKVVFAVSAYGIYENTAFSPTVTVLESNADRVRLQLVSENLPSGQTINFTQPLGGLWGGMNQGETLLQRFTIMVALPNTGNPTLVIENWETETFQAVARTIPENNPNPATVTMGSVGIFGGVRMVPVTFRPITYTNNASTCEVLSEATIRIDLDNLQGTNPVTLEHNTFSQIWQKVFQTVVTNWESIPNFYSTAKSHILMIVPDEYLGNINDFIAWKEQRGIKVTVVAKSAMGNNPTATDVKNRIVSEYESSNPKIDYVILVGDESKLPVSYLYTPDLPSRFSDYPGYPGQFTNEAYFGAIEGTDLFPDVFLGRWVVNSSQEVTKIASRTILHEKNPFETDSLRFEKAVTAADFTEVSQRLTKRKARQMLLQRGFESVDTMWSSFQSPQTFANWVNEGRTFVNYRGSGWSDGWAGIDFHYGDVGSRLSNSKKLPIVTGIGCGVGKFDVSDNTCFGEAWMLAGTPTSPYGAVGFIGPCWNTHTVYNDCLDTTLYRAMLTHEVQNLGAALAAGKVMVWQLMNLYLDDPQVMEIASTLMRQYLTLCDPSLQVYTDTPQRLNVSVPDAIPDGNYALTAHVGNIADTDADSLMVTLWSGNGEFSSQWITPNQSFTTFTGNTGNLDSLILTVTGANCHSYQKVIQVGPSGPYVMHSRAGINDQTGGNGNGFFEPGETINWQEVAWNIGSETAQNVVATLASASEGVTIQQNSVNLGTIAGGDSVIGASLFQLIVSDDSSPNRTLDFTISYQMSNGPVLVSTASYPVLAPNMMLTNIQIMDDDSNFWDRGEAVNLSLSISNTGTANLAAGTYTLSSDDPYVTVLSNPVNVPAILRGESYNFAANAFQIQSSASTPAGHSTLLLLEISSDMGTYQYTRQLPILASIGQVVSADPFHDNNSHYWIYDNSDVSYQQAPVFDWIEIAPAAGGTGTLITPTGSEYTEPVHVPFNFNYYGQTYDTLSISTDGWAHAGRTTAFSYNNQVLPDGIGINGMIAPLWIDLWYRNGETGQICYRYDAISDKFIVEWYRVHDWQNGTHQETFQIQLLNPASYPTESGEAQWIFLYQEVSTRARSMNGGATVGMESNSQTNGFTYAYSGTYTQGAAELIAGRAIKVSTEAPVFLTANTERPEIPQKLELYQNYPNPFNPETHIKFALPKQGQVKLEIYNIMGQKVASLLNQTLEAGVHRAYWRGLTDSGVSATSGIYFYRLETLQGVVSRKMILMK